MSKMVTARIPDEIYYQGSQQLGSLGMGTSDLIRTAFNYLIATGELPETASKKHSKVTDLHKQQELERKLAASRLHLSLPPEWDYKEELARGKELDYEILA